MALQCFASYPINQLVLDIKALHLHAVEANHHVEVQWLPAHCGLTGNTKADSASSIAHGIAVPVIPIPFSRKNASVLASRVAWSLQWSM